MDRRLSKRPIAAMWDMASRRAPNKLQIGANPDAMEVIAPDTARVPYSITRWKTSGCGLGPISFTSTCRDSREGVRSSDGIDGDDMSTTILSSRSRGKRGFPASRMARMAQTESSTRHSATSELRSLIRAAYIQNLVQDALSMSGVRR